MGQVKKILIIDDEEFSRQNLNDLLVANGYSTRLAQNGLSAISLYQSWQPDLVLLDLVMPEVDGFAVCQTLRNFPSGKNIPILIVTVSTDSEAITRAFEVGASDIIFKPVNPTLFLHRVKNHLDLSFHLKQLENDMKSRDNVLRMSGLGCWQWSIDSNQLEHSNELKEILGIADRNQFMTYQEFMDFIHPEDQSRVDLCFWQSMREKKPFRIEHRFVRTDRHVIDVLHQGEVITDHFNKPSGIIGIVQDLTVRKQNENELLLLKQAVEVLPVGVTISDLEGRILYVNNAEAMMHGFDPHDLIGDKASTLAPNHLKQQFILEHFEKTGTWKRESVNLHKNGSEFPVQLASILVRNPDDKPVGVVTTCEEITERKKIEQEIEKKAFYDGLTGLPNRNMFHDRLFNALIEAKREKTRLAVLFVDMDKLKDVNDNYGHEIGDELLKQFSKRINHRMRDADTFARLGGDEFILLLKSKNDPREGAEKAAKRILDSLQDPFEVDGRTIECKASIGISLYPENGRLPEQLVHCADMAMYRAKEKGGFQFVLATESGQEGFFLSKELDRALDNNAVTLLCRPELDIRTGKLVGIELFPCHSSQNDEIMDMKLAQSAVIDMHCRFSQWFLDELRSWVDAARPHIDDGFTVGVPLQMFSCCNERFVDDAKLFFARAGLHPYQVEFSITIDCLQGKEYFKSLVCQLKRSSFRICIDGGKEYQAVRRVAQKDLADKIIFDLDGGEGQREEMSTLGLLKNDYSLSGKCEFELPEEQDPESLRQAVARDNKNLFDTIYVKKKLDIKKMIPIYDLSGAPEKPNYPSNIHYF